MATLAKYFALPPSLIIYRLLYSPKQVTTPDETPAAVTDGPVENPSYKARTLDEFNLTLEVDEPYVSAIATGSASGTADVSKALKEPSVVTHEYMKPSKDEWSRVSIMIDGNWYPKMLYKNFSGANLKLYRRGLDIDPKVSFQYDLTQDKYTVHEANVDLHLDQVPKFRNLKTIREEKSKPSKKVKEPSGGEFEIQLNYYGAGTVSKCHKTPSSVKVRAAPKVLLEYLADLGTQKDDRILHLKFFWKNTEELDRLKGWLSEMTSGKEDVSLWPYRTSREKSPQISFGLIKNAAETRDTLNSKQQIYASATFPKKIAYRDIDEYKIHQAYGEYQEWDYQRSQYESLKDHTHKVQFVVMSKEIVLVRLWLNSKVNLDDFQPSEHVTFSLSWAPEGIPTKDKVQKCKAIITDDIAKITSAGSLTLLVVDKFAPKFNHMASFYPALDGPIFEQCDVQAIYDKDQITKQLYAIDQMSTHTQWNQLFLTQDACIGPITDPTKLSPKSSDEKAAIMNDLIEATSPNAEQEAFIREASSSLRCYAIKAKAPAGTGKTYGSSILAEYFMEIGMAVLCVAPSNPAADKLWETVCAIQEKRGSVPEQCRPIRFHRWAFELSHARQYGADSRSKPDLDEAQKRFDNSCNASSVQFALEVQAFEAARQKPRKRAFANPQDSLSSLVLRKAEESKTIVMGRYRHVDAGQDTKTSGPRPKNIEMMGELRKWMRKLKSDSLGQWEQKDKKQFSEAFEQCAEAVAATRQCLVVTPAMCTRKVIRNFAKMFPGLVVIFEEAAMTRDPGMLVPLLATPWMKSVHGLIMVGDNEQNEGILQSDKECLNAFGPSLKNPLFDRLDQTCFPEHTYTQQYRACPELIEYPNQRSYGGVLTTHPSVLQRDRNEALDQVLAIITTTSTDRVSLQLIDVAESECLISDYTKSRSNLVHAVWLRGILHKLIKTFCFGKQKAQFNLREDMLILTPYAEQIKLIQQQQRVLLRALNDTTGGKAQLQMTDVPEVNTVDSYQGNEKRFIILDLVVSSADDWPDIGFLSADRRMNMACTRAQDVFWILCPDKVPQGSLFSNWKQVEVHKNQMKSFKKMPYIGEYTRQLLRKGRVSHFAKPQITDIEDEVWREKNVKPQPKVVEAGWGPPVAVVPVDTTFEPSTQAPDIRVITIDAQQEVAALTASDDPVPTEDASSDAPESQTGTEEAKEEPVRDDEHVSDEEGSQYDEGEEKDESGGFGAGWGEAPAAIESAQGEWNDGEGKADWAKLGNKRGARLHTDDWEDKQDEKENFTQGD